MNKEKLAFIDLTNYRDWPLGGILTYISAILPYLEKHFYLELWGCSVDGKTPEPLVINGKKYKINCFVDVKTSKRIVPNYFKAYFGLKKLQSEIASQNFNYVYAHTASCLAPFASHKFESSAKKPVFALHQHGLKYLTATFRDPKAAMQKGMCRRAQMFADVVFVVSDKNLVEQHAARMSPSHAKFVSIKSPLNLDLFDKSAITHRIGQGVHPGLRFVSTGRICPWKNQRLLVDAFAEYIETYDDHESTLLIIGEGSSLQTLQEKVHSLGLQYRISLPGRLSYQETIQALHASDIFVFPSKGEGMPLSVLEAFGAGLPVVGFDVEGVNNIVFNSLNGVIVKERTCSALSQGMHLAQVDMTNLSQGSLAAAQLYDSEEIADTIIRELEQASRINIC